MSKNNYIFKPEPLRYKEHWMDKYYTIHRKEKLAGEPLLVGHDTNGIGGSWVQDTRVRQ